MQAPEPEHCVLLEDLAAVRSFWVAPWALEPHVAIGQAPPAAHGTPWQVLCAQHRLVPWAQLQAYDMRRQLRRAQLEDTMYLYVALWLGHLHFTPTMVFGERRLRWPRCRCRRPSHITLIARPSACLSCARGWRRPLQTGWADGLFPCISAQILLWSVCGPFWVPYRSLGRVVASSRRGRLSPKA